jgi:hypothetical protein
LAFGTFRSRILEVSCRNGRYLSVTPLLRVGANKLIEPDDIGVPSKEDLADRAYVVTKSAWDEQIDKLKSINSVKQEQYEKDLAACTTEEAKKKVKKPMLLEPGIASALMKGFSAWRIFLCDRTLYHQCSLDVCASFDPQRSCQVLSIWPHT